MNHWQKARRQARLIGRRKNKRQAIHTWAKHTLAALAAK